MARKRGALSTAEETFIRDQIKGGSNIHSIAVELNRTDTPIQRYCNENNLTYIGMSEEVYDDTILRAKLEEKPYWEAVKKQFNDLEIEYFAVTWIRFMKQFREDIVYSEELQVKRMITLVKNALKKAFG